MGFAVSWLNVAMLYCKGNTRAVGERLYRQSCVPNIEDTPSETPRTITALSYWGVFDCSPIMPRDVSFSGSRCEFFQSGVSVGIIAAADWFVLHFDWCFFFNQITFLGWLISDRWLILSICWLISDCFFFVDWFFLVVDWSVVVPTLRDRFPR